jgi:hypothetical protein
MSKMDTEIRNTDTGRVWVARGPAGAVSLELISAESGVFGPIIIHYPRPIDGEDDRHAQRCEMSHEGVCWPDMACRAGDTLGRSWQTSGQNDMVIWSQLESWYHMRLVDDAED